MQGLPGGFPWKEERDEVSGLCMVLWHVALKANRKYLEVASFELYFKVLSPSSAAKLIQLGSYDRKGIWQTLSSKCFMLASAFSQYHSDT